MNEINIKQKQQIGHGAFHVVYIYLQDDNKVIKAGYGEDLDMYQIEIFQKNPNICPIVYKVSDNYAILEKLDTKKAFDDIANLTLELNTNNILDDYIDKGGDISDDIWSACKEYYPKDIFKNIYNKINNKDILIKLVKLFQQLLKSNPNARYDIHINQFGYDKNNNLKILDL